MNTTVNQKETTTRTDYVSLHKAAVEILQRRYKHKKGSTKEKVDIYLYSGEREIPTQVYVATSWQGDKFPFTILTLPEKRLSEINRGMVIVFNRELTAYTMVRPSSVRGLFPMGGKIEIPLENVEFCKVKK